jgi:hypothetical protein
VLRCYTAIPGAAVSAKAPLTINLYPDAEGPNGPNHVSVSGLTQQLAGNDLTFALPVWRGMIPVTYHGQVTATCASSDSPPRYALPLTLSADTLPTSQVPIWLFAQEPSGGGLDVVCKTAEPVDVTIDAYPKSEGPQGPHHVSVSGQTAPSSDGWSQLVLPPIYRGYFPADEQWVFATCVSSNGSLAADQLTLNTSALPPGGPPLSLVVLGTSPGEATPACILNGPGTGPLTMTAYSTSEGPQGPHHVTWSGQPVDISGWPSMNGRSGLPRTLVWSQFPPGQVTLTCVSSDSPPWPRRR